MTITNSYKFIPGMEVKMDPDAKICVSTLQASKGHRGSFMMRERDRYTRRVVFQYVVLVQEGKTGMMSIQARAKTLTEAREKAKKFQPQWWVIQRYFIREDGTFIKSQEVEKWYDEERGVIQGHGGSKKDS